MWKKYFSIFAFILFCWIVFYFIWENSCGCAPADVSRDAARKAHLYYINDALSGYFNKYWEIPQYYYFTGTDELKQYLVPSFLKQIYTPPSKNEKYYYKSISKNQSVLVAEMETPRCNIISSNINEVFGKIEGKSIQDIKDLLSSYKNPEEKKCFYVLIN